MLKIFTDKTYYTKTIALTSNPVIEKVINKQLSIYKEYISDKNYFIDNKHPLVMILNNIIPSGYEIMTEDEIYIFIKNNIEYLSNVIGCSSNRHKGKVFTDGKLDYIILLDNHIDNIDYNILKVMYTDYEKIDFSYATENEFMVIKLNPLKLVMDYLSWRKLRIEQGLTYSYNNYVYVKFLPMLWESKLPLVIFNRFIKLWYGIEIKKFKNKLPISIINIEQLLDNDLKRLIRLVKIQKKLDIRTFLHSYNYLGYKLEDIINYDPYTFTSTTYWIVWLTSIDYIRFFIDLSNSTDSNNTNNDLIKDLFIDIKRFENRNTIMIDLPYLLKEDFNIDYKYIKEKIKYNL